jgi:hypothetical protein
MGRLAGIVVLALALAGCKGGEIKVRQGGEHAFGNGLRLTIGDVHRGREAELSVYKQGVADPIFREVVKPGRRIPIESFEIEVVRFEDHTLEDFAYLEIHEKN